MRWRTARTKMLAVHHDPIIPVEPRPQAESRWGAVIAILIAVPLQIALPRSVTPPLAWVFLGLALVQLVVLVAMNPRRLSSEERRLRLLSLAIIICLALANLVSLVSLLGQLLARGSVVGGRELIVAAAAVWATGVIVYGLLYWELDAGGPHARALEESHPNDFMFPQQQIEFQGKTWYPRFVDYLYVSLTNAMAFSPTDTMPLSRVAKVLMGSQSLMSLATIVVVGARAINILG
ncbi:MAG: DUF1345 domain-containing protein [Acidimicrobiia bacterium]